MALIHRLLAQTSSGPRATEEPPEERPSLLADKSGAVLLMGLFMCVFLVGMLYYLVGLTDNILFREHMQDASDTGAFAAAVTNARGMNLIVLLNLIMAIVVAIVIMLRMIQLIITAAFAIAAVVGIFCGGCTAPAVAWLKTAESTVRNITNRIEDIAQNIVSVCHTGQNAISYAWPVIGQARSYQAVAEGPFQPPATVGVAFPVYATLPVEDHTFKETCDRGKPFATSLVSEPFRIIPVIGGKVADFIGGAVGGLYDYFTAVYCGSGDPGDPPCFDQEKAYPQDPDTQACADQCQGDSAGVGRCAPCSGGAGTAACDNALAQICHDSVQTNNVSGPNYCPPEHISDTDGSCGVTEITFEGCQDPARRTETETESTPDSGSYSTVDSRPLCTQRVNRARSQCSTGDVEKYQYATERRFIVWWGESSPDGTTCTIRSAALDPGDDRVRADRNYTVAESSSAPPGCRGFGGSFGPLSSTATHSDGSLRYPWDAGCAYTTPDDWGTKPPTVFGSSFADPAYRIACTTELPSTIESAINSLNAGAEENRHWAAVTMTSEIYSCVKNDQICVDGDAVTRPAEGSWKPPKQVCRFGRGATLFSTTCPDREGDAGELMLGDQDFQMRTVVFGEAPPGIGREGVRIAAWGDDEANGVADAAQAVARLSLAQAEFYWDQDEDWHDSRWEHSLDRGRVEWMWDMAWRARLRRIAFSNGAAANQSCGSQGTDCSGFNNFLSSVGGALDEFFLH
ncbi:MAG: hypothetical protein JJ863_07595 [Deltaproteobacteria bacterium]|nr:hypothetical protein [Deltaproteobacteria bacterium]